MKKRNTSKTSVVSNSDVSQGADSPNVSTKNGLFTFSNGDRYEGEYKITGEPPYLVRHGRGTYDTDDFNKYESVWDCDRISDDLHIRFNNETEYRGCLDENGSMSGQGTYFLPDGSSIAAEWKQNKLSRDIRYKEPLGYIWNGEISDDGKVRFMAGNHFWDDMNVSKSKKFESPSD